MCIFSFEQLFAILLNNRDYPHILKGKDYKVCLLFGGNLNDVENTFVQAQNRILEFAELVDCSSIYRSKAWGMPEGTPDFINQALVVKTKTTPEVLLKELQIIEIELGRVYKEGVEGYQSRTIDIDIILIDDLILKTPDLEVPHPRMQERRFVLVPMMEVASEWKHPSLKKTTAQLLEECKDKLEVERIL